jgi:hypothetical protein
MPISGGYLFRLKPWGILAAGLPILAVMPSRCHVAKLITQHHCGVVIDNHDHTHLAHTITHLHHTPDTVYEMGKNAKHTMKSNYTLSDSASFSNSCSPHFHIRVLTCFGVH